MHRSVPLLFMLCILFTLRASAQQKLSLSGTISDTLNRTPLEFASVTLVRASDSVLVTFTRTDSSGAFLLHPEAPGKYLLLVSYPGFADFIDDINLKDSKPVSLGTLPLISSTHLLQEFVLRKKSAAILIKGDTTEYNADSFSVRNGATVDELLKKLPGLQVDKDGKIMAQGEQVQKVLVDGEEFFSDDPAVVTKNLQAAAVDKVQVFDKKSDEAAFTGIDDGQKTKTINLMLKEDRKRGLFGKAIAAAGPALNSDNKGGFFENVAMVNAFKGKRQLSAFGIMSNTGTIGLNWQDRDKFGSGNNRTYDEESGMMYSYSSGNDDELSGSWSGTYSGEGLPTVWTGGLHYADKWAKDQQHLSGNYRYSKNNIDVDGSTITQYILPDSGFVRREHRSTFSTAERHGVDGLFEWTIDTMSNLKLSVTGNEITRSSSGGYMTDTRGTSGTLINTSDRISTSSSSSQSLNANLSYRRKFAKKGRSMSAEVNETYRESDGTGYLRSGNNYYDSTGILYASDSVNQRKNNTSANFGINTRLSYTEPLSKVTFLTFRYGLNLSNSSSRRLSFNRGSADWDPVPDSVYSSDYDYNTLTHNGSAVLRFVMKKYNLSIGADVFSTSWQQHDQLLNTTRNRSYNNYAPSASLKYNFSKQSFVSLNYSGNTSQPTLDQLQPLRQNTDPLNISIGNPDLRQEFRNNLYFNFHSYKPLSGIYTYMGGGGSQTNDDITRSDSLDEFGRHTYKYINVNGNYNAWLYGGYGWKIKSLGMDARVNANMNLSHTNSYVNSVRNTNRNNSYTLEFSLDKDWKKGEKEIRGINLNPSINYNDNQSSISAFTTSYWSYEINATAYTELFWKITFNTEAWYFVRQQTSVFNANNNVLRWNASLSRKFLKGDKIEVRATMSDILNQNLGYFRDARDNYISENRYNTIRRHGLLSVIWVFAKGPDAKTPSTDDDD